MQPRTLEEIAGFVGGIRVQGDGALVVTAVTTDSRRPAPGALFIPLRGERFDGHDFIEDALAAGASALLVAAGRRAGLERLWRDRPEIGVVAVPDTLHGLQRLAAATRRRLPHVAGRVWAVTGSVGKTTTKDMLAAIVGVRWRTTSTRGNYNNEIGLPLTLLEADETTEALVLEMGMRGPGEIRELARIARPDVAVVTNVKEVHLGPLRTVERIASAKAELVDELAPEGVAVLYGDDPRVAAMASRVRGRVLTFGRGPANDVRALDVTSRGAAGVEFTLAWSGRRRRLLVPVPGRHNVENGLAAAAAAVVRGLGPEEIEAGLERFGARRSDRRVQLHSAPDDVLVIDDAYNASPASMDAALDVLRELGEGRRRVAVLGDMLELGPGSEAAHERLGRRAAAAGVDVLVAVGAFAPAMARGAKEAGLREEGLFVRGDGAAAADAAAGVVRRGDVVLVKASRGLALERVVDGLLGEPRPDDEEGKEGSR